MTEVKVKAVGPFIMTDLETQEHRISVSLNHTKEKSGCLIYIDPHQANYIALAMAKISPPRPTVIDIIISLIEKLELKIERVVITELKELTYYAVIHLNRGKEKIELDARPTDAIIIALKSSTEIFINEELLSEEDFMDVENVQKVSQASQPPIKEQDLEEWLLNFEPKDNIKH